jgi:zinc protease
VLYCVANVRHGCAMRRRSLMLLPAVVLWACGGGQSADSADPRQPTEAASSQVVHETLVCGAATGGAAHTIGQLSHGTETLVLEGGVTALLKRTPGNPVVAVRLYFDGGSRTEDVAQSGVTAFALDVATSGGTAQLSRSELAAELAAMGSGIGYRVEHDFSALTMASLDVYLEETWALFRQVLQAPSFPESEIERARERHVHAIRSRRENPDARVVDVARSLIFAGHPYANDPMGTEEAVTAMTREDLSAAHAGLFDPSGMLLVVAGDLDRAELEAIVGDTFAGMAASGRRPPRPPELRADAVAVAADRVPLPTNYIIGIAPAPAPYEPDYPALRLALSHLSDRLFEEVRTNRNLSYAVSAGISSRQANYSYLYVTAVDPAATLPVMAAEVQALRQRSLTETEIEQLVAGFTTGYYQGIDSNGALASELGWWALYGSGPEQADEFVNALQRVTPADIQRVANQYLANYQFGVVGDPDAVDPAMVSSLFAADGT